MLTWWTYMARPTCNLRELTGLLAHVHAIICHLTQHWGEIAEHAGLSTGCGLHSLRHQAAGSLTYDHSICGCLGGQLYAAVQQT